MYSMSIYSRRLIAAQQKSMKKSANIIVCGDAETLQLIARFYTLQRTKAQIFLVSLLSQYIHIKR